jgi:hypothetical protein
MADLTDDWALHLSGVIWTLEACFEVKSVQTFPEKLASALIAMSPRPRPRKRRLLLCPTVSPAPSVVRNRIYRYSMQDVSATPTWTRSWLSEGRATARLRTLGSS